LAKRNTKRNGSISLSALRKRLARPLAGLMALFFSLVFIAANFHEDLEPAPDGTRSIAFYSLNVPERPEVDPKTAGLPEVAVPFNKDCPLCLWRCTGKTIPYDIGGWVPAVAPAPQRIAEFHIDQFASVQLTFLSPRAPPSCSV
jgi:hypothetical protein